MQVRVIGMRTVLILMTGAQSLLTVFLLFTQKIDTVICLSAFLGLTGSRQAFAYLFLTDIVPMTHISFVSMWFSGSLALAVLAQCAYFFFIPHWKYFLIFNIGVGVIITFAGSYLLVESPMQLLIQGKTMQAT